MKRLLPLIGLVLLATAPAAWAKEMPAEVCGADGCVTVSDPGDVGALHSTGAATVTPDPAPFYIVRFRARVDSGAPILWSYIYVPSARALRANDFGRGPVRWRGAEFLHPLVAELTKELEPYPASPTWTPTVPARNEGFPAGWAALGALAAAAVVALALRAFAGRGRAPAGRPFDRLRAPLER